MSTAARLEAEAKYPDHTAGGQRDYKAWAKRLVYRFEHGDTGIKRAEIESAREALNNAVPLNQGEKK
jgi:hypothetical protein